jgi:3-hydroxyisobutyrate dehydrogenase
MKKERIGFLGTGLMGQPMVVRLLENGYPVVVYNRTIEKAERLGPMGAGIVDKPEDAILSAECVIVMLADANAINQVLFSSSARLALADRTVIQMSTIGPEESREIQTAVIEAGGEYLEAPVLGSPIDTREGRLIVLVGGTPGQYEHWSNLLRTFGPSIYLAGSVGQAAALKLALNQLIASLVTSFALSLSIVLREGISVDHFMDIVRQSSYYAPSYDKKLQNMLDRDFSQPNFPVRLMLKDVDLILDESDHLGLVAHALRGVRRTLAEAIERGWGENDYSALFNAINPGP